MRFLLVLAVTALTTCLLTQTSSARVATRGPLQGLPIVTPNAQIIREYLLPRYLQASEEQRARNPYSPRPQMTPTDWLNKEINRINRMQEIASYKPELPRWIQGSVNDWTKKPVLGSVGPYGTRSEVSPFFDYPHLLPSKAMMAAGTIPRKHPKVLHPIRNSPEEDNRVTEVKVNKDLEKETVEDGKIFALTPLDAGYFEPTAKDESEQKPANMLEGLHEGGGGGGGGGHEDATNTLMDIGPRQIRQHPNRHDKFFVASELEELKKGITDGADEKVRVFGTQFISGSLSTFIMAGAIGIATVVTALGFLYAWYSISKRSKAAADVEYPAYGVTGPTLDTSGDRKLAHSAQMYHYQHQKQQIIAMERCTAARTGSVSDVESDEENEEGEYTVYECPGLATTGVTEVRNPLYTDLPTPATPGKCELVKPQPKQ